MVSAQGCVPPRPPVVAFTYSPQYPQVCEMITFNASDSYDPDGWIASYTWNFSDGNVTTKTDPIITHHYELPGTYNVSLTTTDNHGLTNSTAKDITVTKRPFAAFTYAPSYPQVGETVIFDASQSKPDGGHIISYEWDFGDSNTTALADPIVSHVYSMFGDYVVTLNVTDSEGKSDIAMGTITIIAHPHAAFTYEPSVPHAYENVIFNASSSTPDGGTVISYEWDFGDGSSHEFGVIITHQYTEAKNYSVTLNVTDSEGKWDMEYETVEVLPQREDLNEDGKVDIRDLTLVCRAYGSYLGHPRWDPRIDIVPDGVIDVRDVVRFAMAFHP